MKGLNIFKMVNAATVEIESYKAEIKKAETFYDAKKMGLQAVGYINCMITMSNTMICKENNGITSQLDSLENQLLAEIYGAMACKALDTKQPTELVFKSFSKRDEFYEGAED